MASSAHDPSNRGAIRRAVGLARRRPVYLAFRAARLARACGAPVSSRGRAGSRRIQVPRLTSLWPRA